MTNIVYIATSLDGYIADRQGKLDWLHEIPTPAQLDFGWAEFMSRIDAIVMGRNTFTDVVGFDCEWPYHKPVFVLSDSLTELPKAYLPHAKLLNSAPGIVVKDIQAQGYQHLYVDGGKTIQRFLQADLIDEMIITTVPVLLGGGTRLFGDLAEPMYFRYSSTEVLLNAMVKNHYIRNDVQHAT